VLARIAEHPAHLIDQLIPWSKGQPDSPPDTATRGFHRMLSSHGAKIAVKGRDRRIAPGRLPPSRIAGCEKKTPFFVPDGAAAVPKFPAALEPGAARAAAAGSDN
jgi:hypothetical protein